MKTLCGWCRRLLSITIADGEIGTEVSHGICADCEAKYFGDVA